MTTTVARFRAMGSSAEILILDGDERIATRAQHRIEQLEARWSRFRPSSEVSAINAASGGAIAVSEDTLLLARRAVDAHRLTGGRFDATMLPALEALGYDRSFEEIGTVAAAPFHAMRGGGLLIDLVGRTVSVMPGSGFDPGGIGKGLAADLVARDVLDAGARGVLVNLGGDLRAAGDAPDDGWIVRVEDPFDAEVRAELMIRDTAVATSTSARRSWMRGATRVHHLLDPQTQAPADAGLVQVTVIADEGWFAEACTKAIFVAGAGWREVAAELGVETVVISRDGALSSSEGILEAR